MIVRDLDDYLRHIQNNMHPAFIKNIAKEMQEKDKEIERLNSIIKEVREYVKAEKVIKEGNTLEQIVKYERNLLEILDKVEGDK